MINIKYAFMTIKKIFQQNFIWNFEVFIQENSFENVVCKMSAISTQPQRINVFMITYDM